MTDFEVRTNSLNNISSNFSQISSRVRNISNEARSVLSSTRGSITARLAYSLQRSVVCGNIDKCSTDYKNLSSALKKVYVLYNQCEKKVEGQKLFDETFTLQDLLNVWDWLNSPIFDLAKNFPKSLLTLPMFISPWNAIKMPFPSAAGELIKNFPFLNWGDISTEGNHPPPGYYPSAAAELLEKFLETTGVMAVGATGSTLFKGFRDLGSFGNAMKTLFKDGKIAGSLAEGSVFMNGQLAGIDVGMNAKGDFLGASVSTGGKANWDLNKGNVGVEGNIKAEVHLASGELEANVGYLNGKIEGKVGSAEAKGSLEASLWKDGKFAPSIGVEGKASANVAEGGIEASFGSDNYNVHSSAEGSVLGAEAEASAKAGVITYKDKDGTIKTKYGAEAKVGAEAYLAQGEVKTGFTLFGIEFNASVEGKVGGGGAAAGGEVTSGGIGASLDLGLGVGVGVDVSVDWSGFDVSEVKETFNNAVDAVGDGINAVGNAVEDGLDALGDLFGF
ncbi:MAG: hypothetical protein IJE48_09730 [Clostridia bacterium]|nr:hypothetical protein [Clostridia bacterium]